MKKIFDEKHAEFLQQFYSAKKEFFSKSENKPELELEAPFNYYGERGYVDLVAYWKPSTYKLRFYNTKTNQQTNDKVTYLGNKFVLWELKTEITNLGETIRQVKKAHNFFYKAVTHVGLCPIVSTNITSIDSYLIVLDTKENIDFLNKNKEMLEGAGFIGKWKFEVYNQLIVLISNGHRTWPAPFALCGDCSGFKQKKPLVEKL